jgi:type II secretory pathway pseudopilin PulG
MPRARRAFTIIEITIAAAVAVLIMGTLGSVFYYISTVTPQQGDQLAATNDLRLALDWIQRDGVQAHSFSINATACTDPCEDPCYYGYFLSNINMSGEATRTVRYRYECDDGQLVREEWTTEDPVTTNTTIAFHIARCGDVTFECGDEVTLCNGYYPMTVNMTATLNPDTDAEISETDSRHIEMRTARY